VRLNSCLNENDLKRMTSWKWSREKCSIKIFLWLKLLHEWSSTDYIKRKILIYIIFDSGSKLNDENYSQSKTMLFLLTDGVLSEHCPLSIGLSNMLQNSCLVPRKLGRTKSTMHQYS